MIHEKIFSSNETESVVFAFAIKLFDTLPFKFSVKAQAINLNICVKRSSLTYGIDTVLKIDEKHLTTAHRL